MQVNIEKSGMRFPIRSSATYNTRIWKYDTILFTQSFLSFRLKIGLDDRLLLEFCMEFLCSCASLSSLLRFICIDRQILRFAAVPQ